MVKSSSDAFSSFVRGGQVLGHAMVMAGQEAKRSPLLVRSLYRSDQPACTLVHVDI